MSSSTNMRLISGLKKALPAWKRRGWHRLNQSGRNLSNRYPLTPDFRARRNTALVRSANVMKTMMAVWGRAALIRWAASMPPQVGHRDIQHNHVGLSGFRLLHRLASVRGLGDDGETRLALEQQPQTSAITLWSSVTECESVHSVVRVRSVALPVNGSSMARMSCYPARSLSNLPPNRVTRSSAQQAKSLRLLHVENPGRHPGSRAADGWVPVALVCGRWSGNVTQAIVQSLLNHAIDAKLCIVGRVVGGYIGGYADVHRGALNSRPCTWLGHY